MKTKLVNKDIRQDYTAELLKERGVTEDVLPYFLGEPVQGLLQDPEAFDNIFQGYNLFEEIINLAPDKRILLVVDSDVDGFTSSAIMYTYLKRVNPNLQIDYILHEGKGHGLSDVIDTILEGEDNLRYVILPDSSSNDFIFHERLGAQGIKCLVLDHHIVEEDTQFSSSAVIINNQLSQRYQNKDLCGAGVAWQFCRFCDMRRGTDYADDLIDLAALGIVSDMMSVISPENRYIIYEGLRNIKNYFFLALCEKQSFSMGGKINPTTIAFYITPLINALIRVGTMDEKRRCFEAFIDGHQMVPSQKRGAKGTYEEVAIESARECTNARAKQNRILDKAVEELEIKIFKYDLLENKILFVRLDEEDFPAELNGLTAMKLAAKYKRPTIVARLNDEGYDRGSSRGLNESALKSFKDFMNESGYFEYTAGHDNACGISILDKNLHDFHEYANKELADMDFGENWYEVNFERFAADPDIVPLIYDLAANEDIFGQHNSEPLIHVTDINLKRNDIAVIGKNADTIRIEKFGVTYLKFHAKEMIEQLAAVPSDSIKLEIVGRANLNEFAGRVTPQIFITDFQIDDGTLGF